MQLKEGKKKAVEDGTVAKRMCSWEE